MNQVEQLRARLDAAVAEMERAKTALVAATAAALREAAAVRAGSFVRPSHLTQT
jgi:hypothetical protein